jgi:hypothetical protein
LSASGKNVLVGTPAILLIFKQVIRSVVLVLLPIAFISLIVWATAGSSQGSTSDPIFASLWIWLASHQVPLLIDASMAGAKLTLLPLGAIVLVFFAIRSSFLRLIAKGVHPRTSAPLFALLYGIVATLLSVMATIGSSGIEVRWYLTLPITFFIALASTLIAGQLLPKRERSPWEIAAAFAASAMGLLLAISFVVLLSSLIFHFRAVVDLTTVIQPGIFGGLALILIQLLYLPNLIVATLGYICGAGAHLGSDSIVAPFVHRLDQIPAIPLLGALPRGVFPYAVAGAIIIALLGFFIHLKLHQRYGSDLVPAFALLSLLLAFLSSGQLVSEQLSHVGVSWWRFPLVLSGEFALGMALSKGLMFWRQRRGRAQDVDVDSAL